jgi:hypothetical protein
MRPQDASLLATKARLAKLRRSNDVAAFWASQVAPKINKRASEGSEYICVLDLEPEFAKELEAYAKSLGWVCFVFEEESLFIKWGNEAERRLAFEASQKTTKKFVINFFIVGMAVFLTPIIIWRIFKFIL